MIHSRTKHLVPFLASAVFVLSICVRVAAEPVPGRQDQLVVQLVRTYLQRGHLAKPEIDEKLSKKLFQRFIKDLDPSKSFFLKSDVTEFKQFETGLGDMLLADDLSFAYKVYERYIARLAQRVKLVEELLAAKYDFTATEYLNNDYDTLDFPKDDAEVKERWRKRVKFDLLMERMEKKPLAEAEAKKKILNRYQGLYKRWKQLDNFDLMELYLSDLAACVDPHSSYMSPNTLADFDIAMRLNLEGIGALLRSENGQTMVTEIIPGGAADKDGRLKPNDKIIAVAQGDENWVDVVDMKLTDCVKLIRGRKGTPVRLKIIPVNKVEPLVYAYTRQKVELKSQEARGDILEQGKKDDGSPYRIGVIDLPSFYADLAAAREGREVFKSATEDVRKILKDFEAKKVDGVILDLRRNGGGALSEALSLTGLFIDQGPVVQVKGSNGQVERADDPEKGAAYSGPLMVLVSHLSASASEILAGALQDYGRALIVGGSSTHGKGTVQTIIDLGRRAQAEDAPKLGALKLTIQQFYRINGDSTQNHGVTPDVILPSVTELFGMGEKELENALAFDQVQPVEHEQFGLISPQVKATLKARSAERVKDSKDFVKLQKTLERLKARKERKTVPLNEKEFKELTKDDSDKTVLNENDADTDADPDADPSAPKPTPRTSAIYKFQHTFFNNEVLQIMEDFLKTQKA